MKNELGRRDFLKKTATAGLGLGLGARVRRGGNKPLETIRVAVMGVNGRGAWLAAGFAAAADCEVAYICDVDGEVREKVANQLVAPGQSGAEPQQQTRPKTINDFRTALDDPDVDALVIAAPDHWHAPAALMAMKAGKDVYLEKPCGHSGAEGELLVQAKNRYNRIVQMGNQQRSSPESIELYEAIRSGIIGRPYMAWAWYANRRGPIGVGRSASVPAELDWDLWQGPAPREDYMDNVVHYNWHWFRKWGTGEICNNGTHEIDVARWMLGVDFPDRVDSSGGRYHYNDDWEFPDTQIVNFQFGEHAMITWHGRSCNGLPVHERGRGVTIHGEHGTALVDRDGYIIANLNNRETMRHTVVGTTNPLDTSAADRLTDIHIANFLGAIRGQNSLNAPIDDAYKSVALCHLGNIAQANREALAVDVASGRPVSTDGLSLWSRMYEPGWELKID